MLEKKMETDHYPQLEINIRFAPISWYSSNSFLSNYEKFKTNSITLSGIISSKYETVKYHYVINSVEIRYSMDNSNNDLTQTIEIEVPLWNHLKVGQEIELLHNAKMEEHIRIKKENQSQYLPPLKKPGYGKWISIISYSMLALIILKRKRIVKYLNE